MDQAADIVDLIGSLKLTGAPFAVATVVRIRADGTIEAGWIGGGCARAAVLKAARDAIGDGKPRLISVQPLDVLQAQGVAPGDDRNGIQFARNACPSLGTMDVFVEPILPRPELLIFGASPVAVALASLARLFGYLVRVAAPGSAQPAFETLDARVTSYAFDGLAQAERYIVVATQGGGDQVALKAALSVEACYVAFVGSRRKIAVLRDALIAEGFDPMRLEALHAPAGLPIDAVTPDEIALSILAEITAERRKRQRGAP